MNKLSEEQINQDIMHDNRKPLRKIMDDKIIPVAGVTAGLAVGAVKALSQIKQVTPLQTIK